MNLLLLDDADFVSVDRAVLRDRRLKHLREVHRAESDDALRIVRLGGWMGEGRLLRLDAHEAILEVRLDQLPPTKLPTTLLLPATAKNVAQDIPEHRHDGCTKTGIAEQPSGGKEFLENPLPRSGGDP